MAAPSTEPLIPFAGRAAGHGGPLCKRAIEVLQVNVGKRCNQACIHCHVDAGPRRTETMKRETAEACLRFLADSDIPLLDITGGAPELCPEFGRLVLGARALGRRVMDRCNLTVLFEPGKEHLWEFLAEHAVELTCSLPCYSRDNVERQRGRGVFDKSIRALKRLNAIGYGRPGTGLLLDLVYNPQGPTLPPPQARLEEDYKRALAEDFGITFNRLLTITNMPIARFDQMLRRAGTLDAYLRLLADHFNAATMEALMCRNLLSVGFDGLLYDCDYNQMLDMPLRGPSGRPRSIHTAKPADFEGLEILVGNHCYGCTAGAGSSCGGALRAYPSSPATAGRPCAHTSQGQSERRCANV
jgi:radical SAM/Cys-rich protein